MSSPERDYPAVLGKNNHFDQLDIHHVLDKKTINVDGEGVYWA